MSIESSVNDGRAIKSHADAGDRGAHPKNAPSELNLTSLAREGAGTSNEGPATVGQQVQKTLTNLRGVLADMHGPSAISDDFSITGTGAKGPKELAAPVAEVKAPGVAPAADKLHVAAAAAEGKPSVEVPAVDKLHGAGPAADVKTPVGSPSVNKEHVAVPVADGKASVALPAADKAPVSSAVDGKIATTNGADKSAPASHGTTSHTQLPGERDEKVIDEKAKKKLLTEQNPHDEAAAAAAAAAAAGAAAEAAISGEAPKGAEPARKSSGTTLARSEVSAEPTSVGKKSDTKDDPATPQAVKLPTPATLPSNLGPTAKPGHSDAVVPTAEGQPPAKERPAAPGGLPAGAVAEGQPPAKERPAAPGGLPAGAVAEGPSPAKERPAAPGGLPAGAVAEGPSPAKERPSTPSAQASVVAPPAEPQLTSRGGNPAIHGAPTEPGSVRDADPSATLRHAQDVTKGELRPTTNAHGAGEVIASARGDADLGAAARPGQDVPKGELRPTATVHGGGDTLAKSDVKEAAIVRGGAEPGVKIENAKNETVVAPLRSPGEAPAKNELHSPVLHGSVEMTTRGEGQQSTARPTGEVPVKGEVVSGSRGTVDAPARSESGARGTEVLAKNDIHPGNVHGAVDMTTKGEVAGGSRGAGAGEALARNEAPKGEVITGSRGAGLGEALAKNEAPKGEVFTGSRGAGLGEVAKNEAPKGEVFTGNRGAGLGEALAKNEAPKGEVFTGSRGAGLGEVAKNEAPKGEVFTGNRGSVAGEVLAKNEIHPGSIHGLGEGSIKNEVNQGAISRGDSLGKTEVNPATAARGTGEVLAKNDLSSGSSVRGNTEVFAKNDLNSGSSVRGNAEGFAKNELNSAQFSAKPDSRLQNSEASNSVASRMDAIRNDSARLTQNQSERDFGGKTDKVAQNTQSTNDRVVQNARMEAAQAQVSDRMLNSGKSDTVQPGIAQKDQTATVRDNSVAAPQVKDTPSATRNDAVFVYTPPKRETSDSSKLDAVENKTSGSISSTGSSGGSGTQNSNQSTQSSQYGQSIQNNSNNASQGSNAQGNNSSYNDPTARGTGAIPAQDPAHGNSKLPTTQQDPGNNTRASQQDPVNNTRASQQDPGNNTRGSQQDPANNTRGSQHDPTNNTRASQQDPANNSNASQQDPNNKSSVSQQDPSTNSTAAQQTAIPVVIPAQDPNQQQQQAVSASATGNGASATVSTAPTYVGNGTNSMGASAETSTITQAPLLPWNVGYDPTQSNTIDFSVRPAIDLIEYVSPRQTQEPSRTDEYTPQSRTEYGHTQSQNEHVAHHNHSIHHSGKHSSSDYDAKQMQIADRKETVEQVDDAYGSATDATFGAGAQSEQIVAMIEQSVSNLLDQEAVRQVDETAARTRRETAEMLDTQYQSDRLRNEEKQREQKREEDARRLSDTLLTAMATKRQQELDARLQAERLAQLQQREQKLAEETKQEKYIVRGNDTVESIAKKKLGSVALAPLLYELNKRSIQAVTDEQGKTVYTVKVGTLLTLASRRQVREFSRRQLFHPSSASVMNGPSQLRTEADAIRRANIEKLLGPIGPKSQGENLTYIVRLGDSLRSVALKHPALKDVNLWKLVAEINNMPTTTDSKGMPTAALIRGTSIILPTQAQIEKFNAPSIVPCDSTVNVSATASKSAKEVSSVETTPEVQLTTRIVETFSDTCRIIRSNILRGGTEVIQTQLEVLDDASSWSVALRYEISESSSVRHEYLSNGAKRSILIDLPSFAAQEMIQNDLTANWQGYSKNFFECSR
ncbi:MAG: hypothetical protein EKK48_19310 [Candidatus Melainabacteria bacterium]|nr:MAG: hypothetical protein EKK48_19310 [Candidatus Melainabacteria bacterium]